MGNGAKEFLGTTILQLVYLNNKKLEQFEPAGECMCILLLHPAAMQLNSNYSDS